MSAVFWEGNHIPSGRQLPRTPPLFDVKRHLDFCDVDPSEDCEPNIEQASTSDQADNDQNRTFDVKTPGTKTEPEDPKSMLKGMKGYQLTPADLEFIEKMKEEKLIKKLQRDLEEAKRLLKNEMMAAELACASREKAQAELKKFPSCEELTEWVKVVLELTSPLTETADLDAKSLLAIVTEQDVQRAMREKENELSQLRKMVANKKKKEAKERGQLEKQIASEQRKLQGLMSQLFDLKSEHAQHEEAYKALEMQISTQEVEAEGADTSEEPQATKSQVQRRGKERKKAVKSTEKLQDTKKQSKPTKSKHTDGVKEDHVNESLKAKQKSGAAAEKPTKSFKAARAPQRKAEDTQESVQAVRGRRKPPGSTPTAASQPKNLSKPKTGEAQQAAPSGQKAAGDEAAEEAQSSGLRRSKRIASRR